MDPCGQMPYTAADPPTPENIPMRRITWLLVPSLAAACAAGTAYDAPERENTDQVRHRAESERYYVVTRPDLRKCVHPLCGGVYVAEVNQDESTCFGDAVAPDCYAAELDLDALGLDEALTTEVRDQAKGGQVLLRGSLEAYEANGNPFGVARLEVKAAWRAVTDNPPSGSFYQIKDSGIVCITFPCPSISQLTLNVGDVTNLGSVDLTTSGASDADLTLASNAIFAGGLVVSGSHQLIEGPGGQASELLASNVFLPVGDEAGEVCGNAVCGPGTTCCNASCGMCVPAGGVCSQQACAPTCAHDVCSQGSSLTASCSPCASTVCDADAFCCDDSWDNLCVQQAQELCGGCEAPPPPACVHSECESGPVLTSACSTCAATVCATDAFCCDNTWDALCVQQAEDLCNVCAPPPSTCAHAPCATGVALTSTCSTCADAVCSADAYCCDEAWDEICVSEAADLCGGC